MAATPKLAFLASDAAKAQEALKRLVARYGNVPIEEASAIVTLGGDGFMLESLHRYMGLKKPLYGMQRGSIGFLMTRSICAGGWRPPRATSCAPCG